MCLYDVICITYFHTLPLKYYKYNILSSIYIHPQDQAMSVLPPVIPSVATQTQCFKITCSVNEQVNECLHISRQGPFQDVRKSSEK